MDRLEDLANKASQLTMYDIKSYYNQAKNMVLNVSEMEAKVREATNDEAWGASSTLMQEIAQGTHNFQHFNEIMPTIYSRFMEKEAREWRQIYKALTLLEYLVKNGSERVVDDARSHVSTIKMLRSFHYIDQAGKDQGINVRNRAKELADLLGDVDRIRQERRKAKQNRSKYQGVGGGPGMGSGGGGGMSFQSMTGSRYGGFGSDEYPARMGGGGGGGGYDGDVYRGSPSGSSSYNDRAQRPQGFDEYDAGDDDDRVQSPSSSGRQSGAASRNGGSRSAAAAGGAGAARRTADAPSVEEKKQPIVDLFDFGDEAGASVPPPAAAPVAAAASSSNLVDDDFDDFQAAPAPGAPAPLAAAAPPSNANLFDLLDAAPTSHAQHAAQPSLPPAYAANPPAHQPTRPAQMASSTGTAVKPPATASSSKPSGGAGGFDDLWATSLSSLGAGVSPSSTGNGGKNKSIQELEREKATASLWGSSSTSTNAPRAPAQPAMGASKPAAGPSTTFDDLLD